MNQTNVFYPIFCPAVTEGSSCSHRLIPVPPPPLLFFRSRPPLSGGFSETYSALCDYNGISCKEEVQWVRAVGLCH